MRRRASIAALAVAALALTACTTPGTTWENPTSGASASSSAGAGTVAWTDCRSKARTLSQAALPADLIYECGKISVPQNWHTATGGKPSDGKTFDISMIRIKSKNQRDRIGSLLSDPGGPGGSGIDFAVNFAGSIPEALQRFDFIGFDPRGVGESSPVKCISDADLDAYFGADQDPPTQAGFNSFADINRRIGAACQAKYGEDLSLYGTDQAARDMDAIRAAVGDTKLSYLGFSYGTLLGAVYAELFPHNIRAMVLDGAVDPTQAPIAAAESQAKGFERAFDNFAAWCKQQSSTDCPIKANPQSIVINQINKARTQPVRASDGRLATAGWVLYAVVRTMYSQDAWPYLGRAMGNLSNNNADLAMLLADDYASRDSSGHYDNMFDANITVNCTDYDQFPTQDTIRSLQSQWAAKYPVFGGSMATGLLTCALWPVKPYPFPVGPATGAPPIVVVGTTGDPATPYEQTKVLADMLGTGVVLTWQGEGHTAYPSTPCIKDAVNNYLFDLKAPAAGTTCPPK